MFLLSKLKAFCLDDMVIIILVMYRARLGSKAQAWARLDQAEAWIDHEPSPSQGLRLGLGRARAQASAL
jgi:hypothetical protein